MSGPKNQNDPNVNGPGYETRDADLKVLLQFGFGLAVLLAVTLIVMRFIFGYLNALTPLGPKASPFANTREIPTGPLLQASPHEDLVTFCSGQRQLVDGYAWINKAGGIVQIPIDRAMDLALQRGLPSRTADEMKAEGGTIPPVGAAGEPDASYLQGPCGYLSEPKAAAAVPSE
ncbi:MAG TPA: hypothetical protein VIY69_16305 [Candidatus Acidoferrales bacterium]